MIRVVIADDEPLIRSGLRHILDDEDDIEVVGEAGAGADAVQVVARAEPDVVMMDVRMPGLDGIEATRQIGLAKRPPKVLMLTTFDRDEYVVDALRAGASAFLLKSAPPDRLVDAVRVVAAGESLLAPEITRRLIEEHVRRTAATTPPPELAELTERELEVLKLTARGCSNSEIAAQLFLSHATVKTYMTRILAKLGIRDRTQAVVFAYESGVVRPGE
ncbi:MAG TPA: response regulator transcription factor [Gaiellaceae bacterium]|nr:response regulator transcription factor [Gaiellaceae bacterium]